MKRAKLLRNILTVAVAASMIAGCFVFTGCDDKKDDKKDNKKSEKVEDEDEDEEEEEEEKETTTTETEVEETEETEESVEETEETTEETAEVVDEIVIDVDGSDIDLSDIDLSELIPSCSPSDFNDKYIQELAQGYADQNLMLVNALEEGSNLDAPEVEHIDEGFTAMNDFFSQESTSMTMAMAYHYDDSAACKSAFDQLVEQMTQSISDYDLVENGNVTTVDFEEEGAVCHIEYNGDYNVIAMEVVYDFSAMMNG